MLNAKQHMREYLTLIGPWMAGEWDENSFASPAAKKYRNDPSHMIFTIPTRPLPGLIESFLLGFEHRTALVDVIAWVEKFNAAAERFNRTNGDRLPSCMVAHGVIGKTGSGTLKDVWRQAVSLVA